MKTITLVGIVLIVPATAALTGKDITRASREKLIDIGSIKTIAHTRKITLLPP